MADADGGQERKEFHVSVPVRQKPFFLRGSGALDWGMQNRLARIFSPKSGRTVMLAFDHGYFMGPTSGLERIDLAILPLVEHVDVLMCTRGALRTTIPAEVTRPVALRVSAGTSILKELSDERVGVAIDDAVRLDAAAMAVQVFVGGPHERETLENLTKTIDAGLRVGIPTLGVTAVGRDLVRDARYLGLATRIIAELGAHYVKTYYCAEGFADVVAGCPVPIVIAGGKKIPERDALEMCYRAINDGALGVDMGRNIFCADDPVAMVRAVRAVVHDNQKPAKAMAMYEELKGGKGRARGKK
jgi:3-hydroxy-5-phosphonooxypentane-2,4-dione thiolase